MFNRSKQRQQSFCLCDLRSLLFKITPTSPWGEGRVRGNGRSLLEFYLLWHNCNVSRMIVAVFNRSKQRQQSFCLCGLRSLLFKALADRTQL
jgi:hypothetical protein